MRTSTSIKLAVAGVLALLFAGFILRAAMRLASTALHSFFAMGLILCIAAWLAWKLRGTR